MVTPLLKSVKVTSQEEIEGIFSCSKHIPDVEIIARKIWFQNVEMSHKLRDVILRSPLLESINFELTNLSKCGSDIARIIDGCANLKNLKLSKTSLTTEDTKCIGKAIRRTKSLETLDISFNSLGQKGLYRISKGLKENTSIKILIANKINIADDIDQKTLLNLENNTTITTFHFANNDEIVSGSNLAQYFLNSKQISYLDISNTGEWAPTMLSTVHLIEYIKTSKTLKTLLIGNQNFTSEVIVKLFNAVKENKKLEVLNLNSTTMSHKGLKNIQAVLRENKSLKELHIESSQLGTKGSRKLSEGLGADCSIECLNLKSSNIGTEGIKFIIQALAHNTKLKTLELDSNGIKDEGIDVISAMLEENTTLINLSLDSNPITQVGMERLSQAIKKNETLKVLSLANIDEIKTEGFKAIESATQASKSLRSVYLTPKTSKQIEIEKNIDNILKIK